MKCHYCGKDIDTNEDRSYFQEFMPEKLVEDKKEYYYHEKCLIMVMLARAVKELSLSVRVCS